MYIKKHAAQILSLLLLIPIIVSLFPRGSAAESPPFPDASAFLLMEKEDKKVLLSSNEHSALPIASTTKLMTCLVILEHLALSDEVIVSPLAVGVEGSSAYLRANEHLTVEDLLYCLMLRSANDAAVALALHLSGSIEEFARLMNEKAKQIGMVDSSFSNPHGLDAADHYSTAYDLALLLAEGLENPDFCRIVSTKSILIGQGEHSRALTNHNKLLVSLEGCLGGKTGYTLRSGRCLVSACKREDTVFICVTLNCRNDWEAHDALYEYGFSQLKRFYYHGFSSELPVVGFTERIYVSTESFSMLSTPSTSLSYHPICPHFLFSPVHSGDRIGVLLVKLNGSTVEVLPIYARADAESLPDQSIISRIFSKLFALFQN